MKNLIIGIKLFVILTVLTGLIYPAFITLIAQTIFKSQANGDRYLIGQKFDQNKYFWSRPSAVDYNMLPSGGSNLSATSKTLKEMTEKRVTVLLASDKSKTEKQIPSDMIFASGSGLDPHISVAAAVFQAERVAKERKLDNKEVLALISKSIEGRGIFIFGEKRINVLRLNESLDRIK
jgi:K+-transporting ATPase ATPase C chain